MRGGRFQQTAIEDVNARNAEALFETRTVLEVREVEAQTRREIEQEQEELRQLVGASYRDLIESADSILLMRESSEAVVANARNMEEGFESLQNSISLSIVSFESDKERSRRESLFGFGSRVKYLVDTPEKIWGCLDEHMYLEGCERYLRAREVHSLLTATAVETSELFATFPLLRHQWPLVETFRGQILLRSRDRLQEPDLKVGEYAVALAAVGIINELPAPQLFSLFLDTKRIWLRAHLRMANAAMEKEASKFEKISDRSGETRIALLQTEEKVSARVSDSGNIAATLSRLGHVIQASLCHVGELFLEVSGKTPLLFSTILTAPPGSQLFGGIPNPEREVELWKDHREKLEASMVSWSGKSITEACIAWLRKCAEEVIVEGKFLLQHIKTGKELAQVELIVRDNLTKQGALGESLEWLKSAFGGSFDSPWDSLCELLLKEPTSLWEVLFENMFVSRMKEVVDSGFRDISLDGPLDEILSSHAKFEGSFQQAKRALSTGIARHLGGENLRSRSGVQVCGSVWQSVADEKDFYPVVFNPDVTELKDKIDEGLRDVLEDSLSFFQGPQSSFRTVELACYLQEQCCLCMTAVINVLRNRLFALSEGMNEITESSRRVWSKVDASCDELGQGVCSNGKLLEASTGDSFKSWILMEKALFIGRLSTAIGQHSFYLPIILGPPAQWAARIKIAPLKGVMYLGSRTSLVGRDQGVSHSYDRWSLKRGKRGSTGNEDSSLKLKELQQMLKHQSITAHGIWVVWSAEDLALSFSRDLQSDDCLLTSTPLKGWKETILKQEGESAGEVEMKLALPAMPSSYAAAFLYAGCQEIYRVGGHALDKAVLRFFAWKLCEKVLSAYEMFLSDAAVFSTRVSEKGLLQLLFDLRFLADVLSGGQDGTENVDNEKFKGDLLSGDGQYNLYCVHSDTSTPASKKWFATLLSKVLSKLDPIDWATYESHLWDNECRYYQRCSVLFGSLIQLNRLYTDSVQSLSSHGDTNTFNMSGSVPRFTYLPISAPILSAGGGVGLRVPRISQNDAVSDVWSGYKNGDDGYKYGSSDIPNQLSSAGARPLLKSLMGQVGSRFGEGLKLGLLSDGQVERFKDKSAAAISTFGDMLPAQAAGLFSFAGANKES